VRSDLPLGTLAAQLAHAAGESFTHSDLPTYVVVLAAKNQDDLVALEHRLLEEDIPHVAFREPDLRNELTAIGIKPVEDRRKVRRLLDGFSLLGGK
jgi:hypothetical protein